jgi:SSS family transporter
MATTFITQQEGWLIFLAFTLMMFFVTFLFTKGRQTLDEHLVANRKVSIFKGAFSIAVTWIWAPAVFIASQKAYEQGLPGIFWFTFPNIICFFIFAPLAFRLRKLVPFGYSMPDYISLRFKNDKKPHLIFLIITYGYDLGAIIINSLAGGLLMHSISGIDLHIAILIVAGIALVYVITRGMPASVITDVIQMSLILFIGVILVPWVVFEAGGTSVIANGLGGVTGKYSNLFDPWIAYSFGIPASLGLIAGPVADQMFYQRAMSTFRTKIIRTFVIGGIIFGVVPIILSLLGFIAANPVINHLLNIGDNQLVGLYVVEHFLPKWTLYGFVLMCLAALSSTLDSAYLAVGSLTSVDIYKKYINKSATPQKMVRASQIGMAIFVIIGVGIAMIPGVKLLWIFLIYGALASSALIPTILCLYWKKLSARAAFWGPFLSFLIGLPLSIYANFTENANLIVVAALASVLIGLIVCVLFSIFDHEVYEFKQFTSELESSDQN